MCDAIIANILNSLIKTDMMDGVLKMILTPQSIVFAINYQPMKIGEMLN